MGWYLALLLTTSLLVATSGRSAQIMKKYQTAFQNIQTCLTKLKNDDDDKFYYEETTDSMTESTAQSNFVDPIIEADILFNKLLFGKEEARVKVHYKNDTSEQDPMAHYPTGNLMRKSLFSNRSAVHMPDTEYMYPGHCRLRLTNDYMQTALDAFAILAYGNIQDIYNLPRNYVMVSARTISMIKISDEKLSAVWKVFKGDLPANKITYSMLQLYRPLFQYVSAREMAQLNLEDDQIVSFIGTHPQLNRHQVAIVAKKYIQINNKWATPRFMNIMNNLLCGVPLSYVRDIDDSYFLRLTLQTLGKPYSWSARDVSRLGLLLAEVNGPDLSTINPASMVAISAQVMMKMSPENLRYLTETQLKYIQKKSLNILSHKMTEYKKITTFSSAIANSHKYVFIFILSIVSYAY